MPRSSTPKVKRAPNAWARACKEWNEETKTDRYTIPRKGTKEYEAVRAIMTKNADASSATS